MLKLGKMTSRELAAWLGISYNSYKNNIPKYLKIIEDYCEYEKVYGGIIVKEIYIDTYDKTMSFKDDDLYLKEIEQCIEKQNGLATIAGMSRKYVEEGAYDNESTARKRLTRSGKRLFGEIKDKLQGEGVIGIREYVWAIKVGDYNQYRLMTQEEEEILDKIIQSCYMIEPYKIKQAGLLDDMLRKNEIKVEEYFSERDRLDLNGFTDCLFQFYGETGERLVRTTRHELKIQGLDG